MTQRTTRSTGPHTPLLGVCISALALASCARSAQHGPPTLRVGRDECAECGMMISEDRCSAGARAVVDGVQRDLLFDDVACMMDFERAHAVQSPERFVHDYTTRAWIASDVGHFLMADRASIHTPMGSGIVAFATRPAAEAARGAATWPILSYADAAAARRAWMEATYGSKD